jgi:tetratricopeptide (TPR) repeat protein
VKAYHNRGVAHAQLRAFDAAIADFSQVIVLAPADISAYRNRARAYLAKGEKGLADRDLRTEASLRAGSSGTAGEGPARTAAAGSCKSSSARAWLSPIFGSVGQIIAGVGVFIAAMICLPPRTPPPPAGGPPAKQTATSFHLPVTLPRSDPAVVFEKTYGDLVAKRLESGDYEQAIQDSTAGLAKSPRSTALYLLRSRAFLAKKEHEKALADCNQAVNISPSNPDAYSLRGEVYWGRGEAGRAFTDFAESVRFGPGNARLLTRRREFMGTAVLRYLPADADALLVVNVRQLVDSPAFQANALERIQGFLKGNAVTRQVISETGIDPLKDLDLLAVSGQSEAGGPFVACLYGHFKETTLRAVARKVYKSRSVRVGSASYTIYESAPSGQAPQAPGYFGLVNENLLVVSSSEGAVTSAFRPGVLSLQGPAARLASLIDEVAQYRTCCVIALQSFLLAGAADKGFAKQVDFAVGGADVTEGISFHLAFRTADAEAARRLATEVRKDMEADAKRPGPAGVGGKDHLDPSAILIRGIEVTHNQDRSEIRGNYDADLTAQAMTSVLRSLLDP